MNKQTKSKSKLFFSWIHRHRVKIGIWMFLIILPITLVFTAYIGSYTSNKSVYFDKEITEESVKIKKFVEPDALKTINLDIKWDTLKKPLTNDEGELYDGEYKFAISYKAIKNYVVTDVKVTPVLKTDWKNYHAVGSQWPVSTNVTIIPITFNFELPMSPLFFVTIEVPNLYLKVEYTYMLAEQKVTEIEYVKFSLKDLNPAVVISNN